MVIAGNVRGWWWVAGRPQAQQLMIDMCVRFFFSFFFSFYILFSLMILGSGRIYGALILRFFFLFFPLPFLRWGIVVRVCWVLNYQLKVLKMRIE